MTKQIKNALDIASGSPGKPELTPLTKQPSLSNLATLPTYRATEINPLDVKSELPGGFVGKVRMSKKNNSFHNPKQFTPMVSSGQPFTLPSLKNAKQANLESYSNPILVGEPDQYSRPRRGKAIKASKSPEEQQTDNKIMALLELYKRQKRGAELIEMSKTIESRRVMAS